MDGQVDTSAMMRKVARRCALHLETRAQQESRVFMRPVLGCVTCALQAYLQLTHASFVSSFQILFGNFDEDRSSDKRVERCTFEVDDGKTIRLGPCTQNTRTSASPMVELSKRGRASSRNRWITQSFPTRTLLCWLSTKGVARAMW